MSRVQSISIGSGLFLDNIDNEFFFAFGVITVTGIVLVDWIF